MFPCLDEMFRCRRTGQFYFLPFKPARFGVFSGKQTVAQNHRRNFRARDRGKISDKFLAPSHATHTRKNVEQFPAVAAENGLHVAIQTAVRATGKIGAILALRALIMKCAAHWPKSRRKRKKFQADEGAFVMEAGKI
jgi:hypothetical protein